MFYAIMADGDGDSSPVAESLPLLQVPSLLFLCALLMRLLWLRTPKSQNRDLSSSYWLIFVPKAEKCIFSYPYGSCRGAVQVMNYWCIWTISEGFAPRLWECYRPWECYRQSSKDGNSKHICFIPQLRCYIFMCPYNPVTERAKIRLVNSYKLKLVFFCAKSKEKLHSLKVGWWWG